MLSVVSAVSRPSAGGSGTAMSGVPRRRARSPVARAAPAASASRVVVRRAEPVAALYEQGRVTHCASMPELEEQLLGLGAEEETARGEGCGSPDRADALVWGLSELMLGPVREGPRIRRLDW